MTDPEIFWRTMWQVVSVHDMVGEYLHHVNQIICHPKDTQTQPQTPNPKPQTIKLVAFHTQAFFP